MSPMLTRRRFLIGTGGATLALPFLEALAPARAWAAGMPKRLLVFVTHEGTILRKWMPPPGPLLQLSPLLQPLAPHLAKLTVVSGVDNLVARLTNSNGHNASSRTLLSANLTSTAADSNGDAIPVGSQAETGQSVASVGPSIDQAIAVAIGEQRTMNVRLSSPGETRMFYKTAPATPSQPNGARAEVDQFDDPQAAFRTYIAPNATTPDAGPTTTRPFAGRLTTQRRRVLDDVRESLRSLKTKVGAADKVRLEKHEASIERFESGLPTPSAPDAGSGGAACSSTQALPPDFANRQNNLEPYYRAHLDVLVKGLACGVSRVASLQDHDMYDPPFSRFLATPPGSLAALGAVPFPPMQSDWHSNVHGASGGGVGDRANNGSLDAGFTFYASMFRYLLDQMDDVLEPNGKTLLDNSLVLWISEFGDGGSHSTHNLPVVLAGSAGGTLTTGRHVATAGGSLDAYSTGTVTTNDLFLSLHRQMGVMNVTRFGYANDASLHHGGIPELER